MEQADIAPEPHPALNIPTSSSTVSVQCINTTTNVVVPASGYVKDQIPGHEKFSLPIFAFLITHKDSGRRVLFDMGSRKDWWNLAPGGVNIVETALQGLQVEKNVDEILTEHGIELKSITALIWRYGEIQISCGITLINNVATGTGITLEMPPSFRRLQRLLLVRDSKPTSCPGIRITQSPQCWLQTLRTSISH